MSNFVENVRELLIENGITALQLSKRSGISKNTIYNWFERESLPKVDTLLVLSGYFKCSCDYLLGRSDDRKYFEPKPGKFSEKLRGFIKRGNVSIYKISKDTGISRTNFFDWLGDRAQPLLYGVIKLSDYFDVSVDEMLGIR